MVRQSAAKHSFFPIPPAQADNSAAADKAAAHATMHLVNVFIIRIFDVTGSGKVAKWQEKSALATNNTAGRC
jgi:hypothetical protein